MGMELDWHTARALLEWQVELGVSDAVLAEPVDRFARLEASAAAAQAATGARHGPLNAGLPNDAPANAAPAVIAPPPAIDAVAEATRIAASAGDLAALAAALRGFAHCDLRLGARNCVFADGNPRAHVMVIGEGPGAEEDRQGRPFVGPSGQLLDQMFAAIGLSRRSDDPAAALYITNSVPWRPPANRDPTKDELAMLRPFLLRHIELAAPRILVLVGNIACETLIGKRRITKLRGTWVEAQGRPAMPITHPAYLLRFPEAKREAWADLLAIKARLRAMG